MGEDEGRRALLASPVLPPVTLGCTMRPSDGQAVPAFPLSWTLLHRQRATRTEQAPYQRLVVYVGQGFRF
jgi:hypothetical protein